jgi:peptidoglycan/LPS O-acetylase OafA/YrhL
MVTIYSTEDMAKGFADNTPIPPGLHLQPRLMLLDGMRGFAALYVAFHHVYCTIWRPVEYLGSPITAHPSGIGLYLAAPFLYGGMAVALFIAISGFSLAIPVMRPGRLSVAKFYARRLWRITPPYYAGLALSMLLIWTLIGSPTGSHWDLFINYHLSDVLNHFLYIQNIRGGAQAINGAYWSIAVEMQFYLLFPAVVLCFRRSLLGGLLASLTVTASAIAIKHSLGTPLDWQLFVMFSLGISGATVAYSGEPAAKALKRVLPFGVLGSVGLIVGVPLLAVAVDPFISQTIIIASLVAWMVEDTRGGHLHRLLIIFSNRFLGGVGLFAYSLYLVHEPLEQVIWQYGVRTLTESKPWQFVILLVATAFIIVPCSRLFFLVFEEPFLEKRKFEKVYDFVRLKLTASR